MNNLYISHLGTSLRISTKPGCPQELINDISGYQIIDRNAVNDDKYYDISLYELRKIAARHEDANLCDTLWMRTNHKIVIFTKELHDPINVDEELREVTHVKLRKNHPFKCNKIYDYHEILYRIIDKEYKPLLPFYMYSPNTKTFIKRYVEQKIPDSYPDKKLLVKLASDTPSAEFEFMIDDIESLTKYRYPDSDELHSQQQKNREIIKIVRMIRDIIYDL